MTEKAYGIGSTFPPTSQGILRIYSMRFCPYSQRVRLILRAKKIPFETININLKKKPEWYFEIVPQGVVPAIMTLDGKLIFESNIISEYLDELYPEKKLIPFDPYEKAKCKMNIETFQRIAALLFKALKFKDNEAFNEINKVLETFEKILLDKFYGGNEPNITDYMIWPWFERFINLKSLTNYEIDSKRFPKLCEWIERMLLTSEVKESETDRDQMIEFYKASLSSQEPNYDIGLENESN